MRLAHFSDFHFTSLTINPLRLFPKRIFSHLNWILHRKRIFSHELLDQIPDLLDKLKVDLILLGGDFTSSSMPEEFEKAKSLIQKLSGKIIAIPGNHDQYTLRSYKQKLFYKYFSNPKSSSLSLIKDRVEAHKIKTGWWVVAIDTSCPNPITSSRGIFSYELERKLANLLSEIPKEEKIILLNHYPFFQQDIPKKLLERGEALESLIRHHPNIVLYLHGHTHRHSIANLRAYGLPIILDSGSCSQKQFGSWNLIDLNEVGCAITTYQWNNEWKEKNRQEFTWTV